MKKWWIVVLGAALMCMHRSQAQDYKKVEGIIAGMEGSLRTIMEQEGEQHRADVTSLRAQVDHLKALIAVRREVTDSSDKPIASREPSAGAKPVTDVSVLTYELSALLGELKTTLSEAKAAVNEAKAVQTLQIASPTVRVSGVAYSFFTYAQDGTDGRDANRFDFERIYLTAKSELFDGGKFQFTTDIYRNTTAGSYYNGLGIRVKLGFLDLALSNPLSLRVGMIPTQWASFIDPFWKYRGVSMTLVDRQNYFSSADLGVSLTYALPGKVGEVSGYILNGGGYTNPETNKFKDVAARVNVTPFPASADLRALTLAAYAYKGETASVTGAGLRRDRIGGMASYTYSIASATAEVHMRKDALTSPDTVTTGNGLSLFGEVRAPFETLSKAWSLIWRYDVIDPNLDKGADAQRLLILGLSYKLNEKVNVVADYQGATGESALFKRPDGSKTDVDKRWFLHLILTY